MIVISLHIIFQSTKYHSKNCCLVSFGMSGQIYTSFNRRVEKRTSSTSSLDMAVVLNSV